jgi:hypothetical protein
MKLFKFKACDNCGKINPPVHNDTRITLCCERIGGFYSTKNGLGSSGKVITKHLQFPFKITWRGFVYPWGRRNHDRQTNRNSRKAI